MARVPKPTAVPSPPAPPAGTATAPVAMRVVPAAPVCAACGRLAASRDDPFGHRVCGYCWSWWNLRAWQPVPGQRAYFQQANPQKEPT